jgi:hypothetical protein
MGDDSIVFIRKVSSEPNDKLQFYIGNQLQAEWSGNSLGWTREAFAVTAGNHAFRWVYAKNGGTTGGADMAWLDNIVLPTPMCLTIWAGPDGKICPGETFQVSESYGTDYVTIAWATNGTGTFDDNTMMQPVYTPGTEDIENGSVTLSLTLTDDEGNSVIDETVLSFKSAPEPPPTPEGPAYVDLFLIATSEYTTEGLEGFSEYAWHLYPAEAGSIEGNTLKATVTWNPSYLGMAYVSVGAINECGEGEASESFEVTVDNTVGMPDNGGKDSGISLFPNPGNGNYQLTVNTNRTSMVYLKVFDLLGHVVCEQSLNVNGTLQMVLNLENLSNGIYFLNVEGDQISVNKRLVKQ